MLTTLMISLLFFAVGNGRAYKWCIYIAEQS